MSRPRAAQAHGPGLPADFVPFPRTEIEQSIPARFAAIVRRFPDRLAVKAGDDALTYAGLDARTDRIAHAVLDRRGPGAEPVALLFEHGAAVVASLLGVLKAGKFYAPLDPGMPPPRLAELLADLDARLILTDAALLPLARALGCAAVDVGALPAGPAPAPRVAVGPRDLAYVVYTSGSTGAPKGVLADHRGVLHYTMNYTNAVHYTPDDRISLLNALTANAAGSEIYPALLNGAAVLPRSLKREGVASLAGWLAGEGITSYGSVPAVFRAFAGGLDGRQRFPRLRVVRLGGDRLLRSDVELFRRHFGPHCLLRNGFGAAEALLIRQYFIDVETEVPTHVVPIGYALDDTEVLILDEERRPRPAGEVGEIAVKSRYISPGYWRRPDLTAERFLPAPDGGDETIYLTGDLGRLLPDGCLLHLGRKDFQVKVRGKLVSPIEVENALLDLPDVAEAVVAAREDGAGEPRLVAYVVLRPGAGGVGALRQALAARLPAELVPAVFMPLDAMPLTPNRKIDRQALPAPARTRPPLAAPVVPPRTPIETELAAIWADVLGLDAIGVLDPFLELGGDSLLATQVLARVTARFGVAMAPGALLASPTVEAMATAILQHLVEREAGGPLEGPAPV